MVFLLRTGTLVRPSHELKVDLSPVPNTSQPTVSMRCCRPTVDALHDFHMISVTHSEKALCRAGSPDTRLEGDDLPPPGDVSGLLGWTPPILRACTAYAAILGGKSAGGKAVGCVSPRKKYSSTTGNNGKSATMKLLHI